MNLVVTCVDGGARVVAVLAPSMRRSHGGAAAVARECATVLSGSPISTSRPRSHPPPSTHVSKVHLGHERARELDRTRRAAHDARAQRPHIKRVERGVRELRHEHRGHAVQRGAALRVAAMRVGESNWGVVRLRSTVAAVVATCTGRLSPLYISAAYPPQSSRAPTTPHPTATHARRARRRRASRLRRSPRRAARRTRRP